MDDENEGGAGWWTRAIGGEDDGHLPATKSDARNSDKLGYQRVQELRDELRAIHRSNGYIRRVLTVIYDIVASGYALACAALVYWGAGNGGFNSVWQWIAALATFFYISYINGQNKPKEPDV